MEHITLQKDDALLVVDVQQDFLPGGSLAVPQGDAVIVPLNRCLARFSVKRLPVFASRDWHPANHISFREQGGPWPPHCVAGTAGAAFAADLALPPEAIIVSKADTPEEDAYSAFGGTDLDQRLKGAAVSRLFVGGLATDYCVLESVKDALALGFRVYVLKDAVRAVNVEPDDGERALAEMRRLGAVCIVSGALQP